MNQTMERCLSTQDVKNNGIITLCRICLKYSSEERENKEELDSKEKLLNNLISIFEKYNNSLICDKINDIVSFSIHEDDGLPDKICLSCVQALEAAYEFKQMCERSNNMLRSAIQAGVPFHKGLIEDLIKQEHDEPVHSGELQDEDLKHEYEYTELREGNTQGDEFQLSEQLTAHTDSKFKTRAIDLHLECHDCGQFFKSKCKLRVHWKREHLHAQLTCPNCKKVCRSYKSFHAHMKKQTKSCIMASKIKIEGVGKSRVYNCTECEYKTKNMNSMKTHWRTHSGERPYSCKPCNKSYSQISGLHLHNEYVHKIINKKRICKHCGKHIKGHSNYYRHMNEHITNYPCKVCGKVLKSKAALADHTQRHTGIKTHACEICAKMFYGLAELYNHKAKIHEKSRNYKCDKCDFSNAEYNVYSRHKKRHTDSNIPCLICGKFVDNEVQLKLHQDRHKKNNACEHCDKRYYSRDGLLKHMRNVHNIRSSHAVKKDTDT